MVEFRLAANMQTDEESSLDIFETFAGTNEPTKEVVNKELLMFRMLQVDVKDIKCPLEWWVKHESLFRIVAFLAHQILGIISFQISFFFHWLKFLQI